MTVLAALVGTGLLRTGTEKSKPVPARTGFVASLVWFGQGRPGAGGSEIGPGAEGVSTTGVAGN